MNKSKPILYSLLITVILVSACSTPAAATTEDTTSSSYAVDMDSSGGNNQGDTNQDTSSADPDYDIVFPQDSVNEITITISPENWDLMMEDMTKLYGDQGSGQRAGLAGRPGQAPGDDQRNPPDNQNAPNDQNAPPAQMMPGRADGEMMGGSGDQNPVWVEAEFSFEGEIWEHIGIRFKGNSSLKSTWGSGSLKLPFKLDFDQYEDDYPETDDQRFYGFKQLSMASNYRDDSALREKIAADLFREAGVPSAQTAFYAVSIDYGEGPVYFGLYTAVEVVDDTVIETQFSDDNGNVYKPEGAGATFAAGSFSESSFDKETNQDEDDYSDILALYDALHDDSRLSEPESWRAGLEAVFDVNTFLNWLAVNTVIQNWDTYGVMQHNYYLYNDSESGQLVWIPWDNNESMKSGGQMRDRSALQLDLNGVGDNWPLVSYLRDDPVYYQKYMSYLDDFLTNVFILDEMADTYQYYHDLVSPYVLDEGQKFTQISSAQDFNESVDGLVQYTQSRIEIAENYLADQ
jgi:spore coat protein CotH